MMSVRNEFFSDVEFLNFVRFLITDILDSNDLCRLCTNDLHDFIDSAKCCIFYLKGQCHKMVDEIRPWGTRIE
jgi:hypothetical protein